MLSLRTAVDKIFLQSYCDAPITFIWFFCKWKFGVFLHTLAWVHCEMFIVFHSVTASTEKVISSFLFGTIRWIKRFLYKHLFVFSKCDVPNIMRYFTVSEHLLKYATASVNWVAKRLLEIVATRAAQEIECLRNDNNNIKTSGYL